MMDLQNLQTQAIELLKEACSPHGILASPEKQDNYYRIWARDSMIAGISSLITEEEQVIKGFRDSILTLAEHQNQLGMIPSNISLEGSSAEVSYGTLAGRIDANSWFIIGSCLYLLNYPDGTLLKNLYPKLQQTLKLLDCWEFNDNDLLYTPVSGNWADEYPVKGHTLYDNLLRFWALKLYNELFDEPHRERKAKIIKEKIQLNFWPVSSNADHPHIYHRRCFQEVAETDPDHFACAIDPTGYNMHFDAAGHGMALLLGFVSERQMKKIFDYIKGIFRQVSTSLMPAFWPVITSDDAEWEDLKNNFSYNFKNYPHHFHNGGIWPVWMGLFGLGASIAGHTELAENMLQSWMKIENPDKIRFSEYIASDTLEGRGKNKLCFSASGLLFLIAAIDKASLKKLYI